MNGFKELARFGEASNVNFGMLSLGKSELMAGKTADGAEIEFVEFVEDINNPFYGGRGFGIRDMNGYSRYFLQPDE